MPMSDEERKLRSARARETVSLPFLLLPRTPSSSLLSLPCADAQGWKATSIDNARKFHMKFTVAVLKAALNNHLELCRKIINDALELHHGS